MKKKHDRKLTLGAETVRALDAVRLSSVMGGIVVETEPYSACGLCEPYTIVTCRGC